LTRIGEEVRIRFFPLLYGKLALIIYSGELIPGGVPAHQTRASNNRAIPAGKGFGKLIERKGCSMFQGEAEDVSHSLFDSATL
jgi:hypothetical protein